MAAEEPTKYRDHMPSLDMTSDTFAGGDISALNEHATALIDDAVCDAPFTPEVVAKIAALKEAVAGVTVAPEDREYWTSEHALHRFLGARQFDVAKATAMYKSVMAWRIEMGAGKMLTEGYYNEPIEMRRYFPTGIVGQDKAGFPVLIERIGKIDLIGMAACLGQEEFLRWVCAYHERQEAVMRHISAKTGRSRHMMTCVIDMKGMSMTHLSSATLQVLRARLRLEQDNYPEVARRVFMINTPTVFSTVWGVVKHFLDAGTLEKIHIMGSNYLPTLRKYIDDAVIPASLGGGLKDRHGSPDCWSLVGPGGLIPSAYHLGIARDGLGMGEEVHVSAGKHSDVIVKVGPGSTLHWKWGMSDRDIGFSVSAVAAAEATPAHADVVDASTRTRSVCGVQLLRAGYDAAKHLHINGGVKPATHASAGDLGAAIPGAAAGATATTVLQPLRGDKHSGSYTVPAGGGAQMVRLRWDNSSSWMTGKNIVRRVDVLLPEDSYASPVGERLQVEEDPLEARAVERQQAWKAIASS